MASILDGSETSSAVQTAPQVFWATHDGLGRQLPGYLRSFISFSYGEKHIEDFGLIAYCNGQTMERSGSAEFEDLTSSYDILDGETYHGTHFKPFELSLSLVSDGLTQKQLEKFKGWFRGGITRRLVLAEHPNRFIYARLKSPPQFHLTPFQLPFDFPLGTTTDNPYTAYGLEYESFSTLYKGTIDITFISSDPFWKAFGHLIGQWNNETNQFLETWEGQEWDKSLEVRRTITKIAYEDNIPIPIMATGGTRMAFGHTGTVIQTGINVNTKSQITRSSKSSSSLLVPQANTSKIIVVEKEHRPIALPLDDGILTRYDTVVAEPNIDEDKWDSTVAGNFMWWDPWNWDDTFNPSLTGEAFQNQYDRNFVRYHGARVLRDDLETLVIDGYTVKSSLAGSFIVDAYDYPQVLGKDNNEELDIVEEEEEVIEDEEEYEEPDSNRGIVTRGQTKAITKESTDLKENQEYYFFYGGTAPSPARITFALPLKFGSNTLDPLPGYEKDKRLVTSIASSYHKINDKTYSTITIEGSYKKEVSMSTPNIITSYNKVIDIISHASGWNVVDLEEKIRDEIRHPYVREYALKALSTLIAFKNSGGSFDAWVAGKQYKKNSKVKYESAGYVCTTAHTSEDTFDVNKWEKFDYTVIPENKDSNGKPTVNSGQPDRRVWANMVNTFWSNDDTQDLIEIVIDSNTSKATGKFHFKTTPEFTIQKCEDSRWLVATVAYNEETRTEDIGDAMRSTWYYIDERNEFKENISNGTLLNYSVEPWSEEHPEYSHKVTTDFPVSLKHFSVDYEYMYL